ncbi:hypothetical protein EPO15_07430 [bacterium]|nr:MAG: hypothetical protein EPO15_07430 [bacterium]
MAVPRPAPRLLVVAALLASAGYGALRLRELAGVKAKLDAGASPEAALAKPQAPAAEPEEPPPADPGGQRLLSVKRGPSQVGSGSGVLIDHKTGQRLEVGGGSALPRPPAALRGLFSDDLNARRNRAYALLLGTAAFAVALVVRARRALKRP